MLFHLHKLLDPVQCHTMLRQLRWPEGVRCPHCQSEQVVKNGKDVTQPACQHYHCRACGRYFDDLTDTLFAGSQQPLSHWITALYLLNLNVSARQIAQELLLSEPTAQAMCATIREGIAKKNLLWSLAQTLKLTRLTS